MSTTRLDGGRLLTDRDELLPSRPVRTFNLRADGTSLLVPALWGAPWSDSWTTACAAQATLLRELHHILLMEQGRAFCGLTGEAEGIVPGGGVGGARSGLVCSRLRGNDRSPEDIIQAGFQQVSINWQTRKQERRR
ncbi:hypothetical protein EYF80_017695 [Liparis tanakae]|uniref:Uncharacterized protein n=1 Tax=Liparis tanakae TaxID=230148 RepID=A0A4Z2I2F6_9TELE|nr:hypothetical protein EYF80_017695 [Liparis tanakae]